MNNEQKYYFSISEIEKVEFYLLGDETNEIDSSGPVINKELFANNKPVQLGVYNLRMGVTDSALRCHTCLGSKKTCPGHFGSINVPVPCMNTLFIKYIYKWLKILCHNCGDLMINLTNSVERNNALFVNYIFKEDSTCNNCNKIHPKVIKDKKDCLVVLIEYNNEEPREIYSSTIKKIFNMVPDDIIYRLGLPITSHPKNLLLNVLRVTPNAFRPDIRKLKGSRSNNSDITALTKNIVMNNSTIPINYDQEINRDIEIDKKVEALKMNYYNIIKDPPVSNTTAKLSGGSGQPLASISSRLRSKEGRIRGNLEGKRVHYAARSVISGDNNIHIHEVGVPISIARNLQVPEVVQAYNYDRLSIYFNNKTDIYPGCARLVKRDSKNIYDMHSIKDSIVLEYGDILWRDIIDGDYVLMNRAPSLLYSAVSGHRVKVLMTGDTLRLSVNVADALYGGDFDGDHMSMFPIHNLMATTESMHLGNIHRWFISYKDSAPSIGIYHDNLIGTFELTKSNVNIDRYHMMQLLSQVNYNDFLHKKIKLTDDIINGRDLISLLLPAINYYKKSAFYKPEYSGFIQYDPNETHVNIKRGKILSGRLDKKSIGPGVNDSLFHNIHNENGCDVAMNLIYNIQQMTTIFLMMRGYTINYDDIAIKEDILYKINDITGETLHKSELLTKKFREGKLIPPIGMNTNEFYENEQINILTPGDDFTEVVMSSLDHENNNLYKLVASGTKGKPTNILQICSSLGQMSIDGKRIARKFDFGRCSPYFNRFHDEANASGFIPESFSNGIPSISAISQFQDNRNGLIHKGLSTARAGYHNRKCDKTLQSIIIDNFRSAVKYNKIVQLLYGDNGCDIRKGEMITFANIFKSDKEFKKIYSFDNSLLPNNYQNKKIFELLDINYNQLVNDRNYYRTKLIDVENMTIKNKLLSDQQILPININKIIEDILYQFVDYKRDNLGEGNMDLFKLNDKIQMLKNKIQYSHFNEIQEHNNTKIPEYISISFTLLFISINLNLNLKRIINDKIDEKLLDLIINKVCFTFKESLVQYGTPIGTISSECSSESMTQRILSVIHAVSIERINFLGRNNEVFGAVDTSKMEAPYMDIFIKDEHYDKLQEIANDIEMMILYKFIPRYQIFFEDYKNIVHPNYIDENKKLIETFERHTPNHSIPNDLLKYCIRIYLSQEMLIEKNLTIVEIYIKLKELYPLLHIIYTDDNSERIIMRIYISKSYFKKTTIIIDEKVINDFFINILSKTIIRGIDGINAANILTDYVARSYIDKDGSIQTKKISIIRTSGTNLKEIINHPYIDQYKTTSNSILEVAKVHGIHIARQKMIIELRNMIPDVATSIYNLIADELTSTGSITNIEKSGFDERNPDNSLLSISYSHPIQKLENVAINNEKSIVHNALSSSLLLGTTPNIAGNYNSFGISETFLKKHL